MNQSKSVGSNVMNIKLASIIAAIITLSAVSRVRAETIFYGPTPYLSAADSPFDLSGLGSTFWLEDFEDGELNTPGVRHADEIAPLQIWGPDQGNDSVDFDDGVLDGLGKLGRSVRSTIISCTPEFCSGGVEFRFDPEILGGLPTQVGIVWTDGGPTDNVSFAAYSESGELLGSIVSPPFADMDLQGGTAEDRFFGAFSTTGISYIQLGAGPNSGRIEIDHLQYGNIVPEPATFLLVTTCVVAAFIAYQFTSFRRQRQSKRLPPALEALESRICLSFTDAVVHSKLMELNR
jgi:hypothetical protein